MPDPEAPGPESPNPPNKPGRDNNLRFNRGMMWWMIIVGAGLLTMIWLHPFSPGVPSVPYSDFHSQLIQRNIKTVLFKNSGKITFTLKNSIAGSPANAPLKMATRQPPMAMFGSGWQALVNQMDKYGVVRYKSAPPGSQLWLIFAEDVLPYLILFGLIYFLFFRNLRGGGGGIGMLGNFGRSRHRMLSKEHTNVTFNDVAGIDEAKEELTEIVEFLRNPKRFQRLGGRIPRGVLLIGSPGVGKTLLAKAIAGEAEVPFFSISGSDFVEMFVGVGASRVRDLFKTAKESSPCIIFLDEIDAVGRRRGNGFSTGGHDEREQTLNAILVEMDGFDTNDQVIVIAATNRSDVLDPALTRPGRFDRQVTVPLPDIKGRYEILKVHAKKVKLAGDVDLLRIARQTPMFSGAELAAMVNESALIATMLNHDAVEMADLEEARDKIRFGKAHRSRKIDEEERVLTAWHEAGHAVVQYFSPHADPIHKVTIIPRGSFGGATFSLPEKDRFVESRAFLLAELRVLFGGRIAEAMPSNEISSGASQDIRMASAIARQMVCELGMSDALGPILFTNRDESSGFFPSNRPYSEKTAELIDAEVHRLITTAYDEANKLLHEKMNELTNLKDALLKYETLDAEDVKRIMSGQLLTKPTVTDLLAQEQQRRVGDKTATGSQGETGPDMVPQPG
ncbi:MAG: ATP-dependent zinc metalloprotease FtsH [Phycisphaerae bacterium]